MYFSEVYHRSSSCTPLSKFVLFGVLWIIRDSLTFLSIKKGFVIIVHAHRDYSRLHLIVPVCVSFRHLSCWYL